MRVAVITPYYKEPLQTLIRNHNSVLAQTYKNVHHIMIADGFPNSEVQNWKDITHIAIPNCGDFGDTPRGIGSAVAACHGYDAIAFLDADCWYESDHIENMVSIIAQDPKVKIVTSPRNLYRTDGTFLGIDTESNGEDFNDTNCYLIHKDAYAVIRAWMLKDKRQSIVGDRYVWAAIKQSGFRRGRTQKPTINYTTEFAVHYLQRGENPPPGAKIIIQIGNQLESISFEYYQKLITSQQNTITNNGKSF